MLILEYDEMNDTDSAGQMLSADIKKIFNKLRTERIFSNNLVDQLTWIKDRPWCEWRRGKPLTQNTLSKLLKPFGIRSKMIRINEDQRRGYKLQSFQDSFTRYLPSGEPPFQSVPTKQINNFSILRQKQIVPVDTGGTLQKEGNSLKLKKRYGGTLQNPNVGDKGRKVSDIFGWEEL